jgi:membrane-associated phospholipid phosphatase
MKDKPLGGSLNIVDRCTLAYNAVVALLVILFQSRIPQWHLQVLLNIVMIAVVLLAVFVIRDRAPLVARLARNLYPMALFFPMYEQAGSINHIVFPGFLNPLVRQVEESIFGFQPAIVFAQKFPQKWLAEYMHFAYSTYYLLFPGLGVFLCLRRTKTELLDYMFSLCVVMYVCFLFYIFLPVRDPCYEIGDAPGNGPFTWIMTGIYRHLEVQGAAFPSSHVAAAAVVLYYTFRCARAALWAVGPIVISLMVATVYCRYHYAIDVLAGLATATILIALCRKMNPDLRRKSQPAGRKT